MTTQEGRPEERPTNVSEPDYSASRLLADAHCFGVNARPSDPDTSHAAAKPRPVRGVHRARIMALFVDAGTRGQTDAELVAQLDGMHPGSVSKRRGDLVKLGLVERTDMRRRTSTGCTAIVWVATSSAACA